MGELERMDPLLVAVEQASDALVRALQDAINAAPSDQWANGVRYVLGEAIDAARKAGQGPQRVRLHLAEHDRPKGPMVTVNYTSLRGNVTTGAVELASVTASSLIMRGGERYSRKTGRRVESGTYRPAPYITDDEMARVLALKWKPPSAPKEGKAV